MNQYSELMGSFIRTGNFPIEADYIFESKEQLEQFYSDELNKTLLHKGWFKIVDNGDAQSLYWVKEVDGELKFSKLISEGNINEINEWLDNLQKTLDEEIVDRDLNDEEEKSRLQYLENAVKAIVGNEDDAIAYLETLDYKNLTELSNELNKFMNTYDEEDESINTLPELKDFLAGYDYKHNLHDVLEDLWNRIEGDPTPNLQFRTLRGIQDFITLLESSTKHSIQNLQTELDQTQIGVGLNSDGLYSADQETYYLKNATSVMNALRTLDSLINQAINNCNLQVANTESVELDIKKELDKTTISAKVKVSSENGNDIITKNDGIYHNIDSEYKDGTLTIKVNGNIRQQHDLGISTIVDDGYYDSSDETIVIIFRLHNGEKQTIRIPVTNLIQEWIIDNSISNKVVELEKIRVVDGADKLSADVRLSSNKYNIIEKDGNTLLVKGISDNIVYDGDITVKSKLDLLSNTLDSEIQRSKDKDVELEKAIHDETDRASLAEQDLQHQIKDETTRATDKEAALDHRIDDLKEALDNNTSEDLKLNDRVTNLEVDLDSEVKRAKDAEHVLQDNIDAEKTRATHAEDLINRRIDSIKGDVTSDGQNLDDLKNKVNEISQKLNDETNRATIAEQSLSNEISELRTTSETKDSELLTKIESETIRAEAAELALNTKIETIQKDVNDKLEVAINQGLADEITRATEAEQVISTELSDLINKCIVSGTTTANDANIELSKLGPGYTTLQEVAQTLKTFLDDTDFTDSTINKWQEIKSFLQGITDQETLIGLLESVRSQLGSDKQELIDLINTEVNRATNAERDLSESITAEQTRAEKEEQNLSNSINLETLRAEGEEKLINQRIDTLDSNLTTTTSDLKTLSDNFNTEVVRSVDRDTELQNNITNAITKAENDLNQHIIDYSNPHKVTAEQIGLGKVDNTSDLDKPVSVAVQDALNKVDLELAKKTNESDFQTHILNNSNPHNVTKEQIGLGNVDNTSDIEKPISNATQIALDKKSDLWHTHTMADIADLENLPVFIDFIETMLELPSDPADGDRYLMITKTENSNARYLLLEYDAFYLQWKQKLITTGMIASNINKDVWKLNATGPERILDVSDYKYFYNKIYDETKNLIEDIDWEEDDETSDTNHQIRLKITYKTSYGDPNEEEATNPYKKKNVKYIDIEKARFLQDAYSRPALQSDVNNGYATKIGEPMLILVMTTGDYVAISLKDALNIYDPIDTASIDMSVTDWTGNPETAYKVSAVVRLASTKDQETAVSLHILDGTEKGMYATLHTSNTNCITLNPSTGSGQKTLSATLILDNSGVNNVNNSNIVLTKGNGGLYAEFIWGEYD